ncbi:tropomyosin isoform X2 [Photinus pyralis]|nr:tropomyosin isoform X2 [Photinus pyralis]
MADIITESSTVTTVSETTEVRCQEKTRGGLCYEVILSEPEVKATPPKRPNSPNNNKNVSIQDIEDKLRAAEERRQQLELNKVAALSAQIMKIEEASRKKDEQTNNFISVTRDALEQKMETHIGKREAYIHELKSKMKDHIDTVEKTRLSLEQQCDEVRSALEEKMNSASHQRDENIKKMLERLKAHEEQVHRVKASNAEKFQQLETTIQEKLDQAKLRREQLEQEQKDKLRTHNTRAVEIKSFQEIRKTEVSTKMETKLMSAEQKREKEIQRKLEVVKKNNERQEEIKENIEVTEEVLKTERSKRLETKLTAAELNREKEIQRKLEVIKKNERRAEIVRQNKANNVSEPQTIASSG